MHFFFFFFVTLFFYFSHDIHTIGCGNPTNERMNCFYFECISFIFRWMNTPYANNNIVLRHAKEIYFNIHSLINNLFCAINVNPKQTHNLPMHTRIWNEIITLNQFSLIRICCCFFFSFRRRRALWVSFQFATVQLTAQWEKDCLQLFPFSNNTHIFTCTQTVGFIYKLHSLDSLFVLFKKLNAMRHSVLFIRSNSYWNIHKSNLLCCVLHEFVHTSPVQKLPSGDDENFFGWAQKVGVLHGHKFFRIHNSKSHTHNQHFFTHSIATHTGNIASQRSSRERNSNHFMRKRCRQLLINVRDESNFLGHFTDSQYDSTRWQRRRQRNSQQQY